LKHVNIAARLVTRTTLVGLVIALCGFCALADEPAEDRAALIRLFGERFANAPLDDYVYGALIANPGGREQYEQIMEFPPFIGDIEQGKKLWETPFRNGKRFADCFPNGGRGVLVNYPYFDEKLGKVVTFENAINGCLRANGEAEYPYGGRQPMGVLTAYARTLSDGSRLNVRIETPAALAKYRVGRELFFRRIGQLNASCAGCHIYNAGNIMRMEIISPVLGHATHWPIFRGGEELMTLQGRFKRCMEQMRAQPFGYNSEEWNDLEYYVSALSNGLPLKASVFRK
jgi:L-cysteine S-thiosulfotransferase